ncbi:MAG: glycosyltransferase [Gammaproteobacteria bacterium]|nr:glycosyltransferase [Gammaproteobacteria bacterium]
MLSEIPRYRAKAFTMQHAASIADFIVGNGSPVIPDGTENDRHLTVLAYGPYAHYNMFQRLLYQDAWNQDFVPVPVRNVSDLGAAIWPGQAVYHLHWLTEFSGSSSGASQFEAVIERLKRSGHKIAWTVHNVLPHGQESEHAIKVRRTIADAADAIHIMNRDTPDQCRKYFDIDSKKVFRTDHPSYLGAYANYVSKLEARYELGIEHNKRVGIVFGSIDIYKGIEELIESYQEISRDDTCLVIAGSPKDQGLTETLRELSIRRSDLIACPYNIPAEEVQYFFRAADFAVCPYRRSLNSGAAMLAMTFSVPVVAPTIGAFDEIAIEGRGILYSPAAAGGLKTALTRAFDCDPLLSPDACVRFAEEMRPSIVSQDFLQKLRNVVFPE